MEATLIIGKSKAMLEIEREVKRVAPFACPILIRGETGTGKELLAERIRQQSSRADKPFVSINCGALTDTIAESLLFGHEEGSFTGATRTHVGIFEQGEGGTVFLDEIGEMSLSNQTQLLRALDAKKIRRVGATQDIPINVRIICATNVDIQKSIAEGRFRKDLYYRLQTIELYLPPLRERLEDIDELVGFLLSRIYQDIFSEIRSTLGKPRSGLEIKGISAEVLAKLREYSWPGNIRELRAVLERAAMMSHGPEIDIPDLPTHIAYLEENSLPAPASYTMEEINRAGTRTKMELALVEAEGNLTLAAKILGIDRRGMLRTMLAYGIRAENFKLPTTDSREDLSTITPRDKKLRQIMETVIRSAIREARAAQIELALQQVNGNRKQAAKLLGVRADKMGDIIRLYKIGESSFKK